MNTTPNPTMIPTGKARFRFIDDQGSTVLVTVNWDAVWVQARTARRNKSSESTSGPVTVKVVK